MANEIGVVLYECSKCRSYSDISVTAHIENLGRSVCKCGHHSAPVVSPAQSISDLVNKYNTVGDDAEKLIKAINATLAA